MKKIFFSLYMNWFFRNTVKREQDTLSVQIGKVMRSDSTPYTPDMPTLKWFNYDTIDALRLSAVYAALSIISNSIATLPIYVKQHREGTETILENNRIQKLFYNMLQSKHTVIKQLVWDLLLYGNSYVYIKRENKIPVKLIYLQRGDVTIDYRKQDDLVIYNTSNHKSVPKQVKQEDMLHFARDTRDGIEGRGFLTFAAEVVNLAGFTQKAAEDFFGSGCNLTGILQFKRPLKPEQQENIRKQWMQIHSTSGGGLGVLEGDSEYIPISQNSSDSQMLETREFNITEIARFFNINPILLGDLSHSSYNSIEDAQIEFVTHTLLPIINLMEEEMNRKLISVSTQYIDFDETELLKGDMAAMANYLTSMVDKAIMTRNEARKKIGLNPVEGGDDLILPYTDIAQNTINETNEDKDEENEQQNI